MHKKFLIWAIIIAAVAAGLGFASGSAFEKQKAAKGGFANGGGHMVRTGGPGGKYFFRGGAGGQLSGGERIAGGFAAGQILNVNSDNIVIAMPDGSTKIVLLSGSTKIDKSVSGSQSDLKSGESVFVSGTPNSDGSMSANSIDIRPAPQTNG